ncbi:GerAB/ArcD/ProY family transporter, partial [Neobacillus drentensis]|uniref:GerAB/ArcD/ProY family transporter n=1 Tax=Neobacillus drentensis TaxID=220684 RepID=UPI002FFE4E11
LPLFDAGVMPLIKGAFTMNGWFSEFFMIIFLLPFLVDKNKGRRRGFQTILAVTLTIVVVNITVLFVLGNTSASKAYPLITAWRYISFADFFENLESIAMAVWVAGAFIKISVFYYVSAIGTAQWLNLSDYRPVIWPLGILMIEFGFWSLPSSMEVSRNAVPFLFYAPLLQTFVPLILLLIAVIRKKTPKEQINLKEGRG